MSDPESLAPIDEVLQPDPLMLSIGAEGKEQPSAPNCTLITAHDLAIRTDYFEVICTTKQSQIAVMELQNGQTSGPFGTDHPKSDQIFFCLGGTGQLLMEDEDYEVHPGDTGVIVAGARHQFMGKSELPFRTVNVYAPAAYPDES